MRRRRLVVTVLGAVVVLTALPASAQVRAPAEDEAEAGSEALALRLLDQAAAAGRALSWTGTQYVATWRDGATDTAVVELEHDPVRGSVVAGDADTEPVGVTAALDPRLLYRLAASYDLSVSGPGRCTGRTASVVEARRPDGALAGRFWVDRESGLLLRREVFDAAGARVSSSAFVDLDVTDAASTAAAPTAASTDIPTPTAPTTSAPAEPPSSAARHRPGPADVEALRERGWSVPTRLPGGFALLETSREGAVLHLAYTDGLSTLSVFQQVGGLGGELDGFARESIDGHGVWVRRAAPERVVWSGDGRVFTLVSDAPEEVVRSAVAALPHDEPDDDTALARLGRGTARLAGMLNPFD